LNATPVLTDTNYYQSMIQTSQALNQSYGYLWWLNGKSSFMVPGSQLIIPGPLCPSAPADMYAGLGKNGQVVNIAPSQNLVWIRMGDAPGAGIVPILMNDTIWQKLNAIMCAPNEVANTSIHNEDVRVYPNPANSMVNIDVPLQTFSVEIKDLYGRNVFLQKGINGKIIINTSTLPNGIYTAVISTNENKRIFKIAIHRN
jgi:hypothetical protein